MCRHAFGHDGSRRPRRHCRHPVALEPTATDWGTEMAMIAGPEQIVVSVFRVLT
jgi:hypothetical protein